jgi:hypothetical protein
MMDNKTVEFKEQTMYKTNAVELINDLTATNNTPKEGAMTTNTSEIEFETYVLDGVKCVDRNAAMAIIGLQYPNELKQYVEKGKVKHVGTVQAKGKVMKNVFSLESVLKAKEMHKVRGSDMAERFEIEIHSDVLAVAVERLAELADGQNIELVPLLKALKAAENLTEKRRQYNANKKA